MPEEIEYRDGFREDGTLLPFSLPKDNWYDEEGRIYKDILIENFNAIQDKLLQISQLNPFNTTPPDVTQVVYPDVTLESEDTKIVNVNSLVDIMHLVGFPLECTFSNNIVKKIVYYNNYKELKTLTDISVDTDDSKPYIYLNYVDDTINASSGTITPSGSVLIGCFTNNSIKGIYNNDLVNINLLWALSQMSIETKDVEMKNSEWFRDQWIEFGWKLNGGTVGATDLDTRSGGNLGTVTFNRIGRK